MGGGFREDFADEVEFKVRLEPSPAPSLCISSLTSSELSKMNKDLPRLWAMATHLEVLSL